jgi:MoxR-like ATPase
VNGNVLFEDYPGLGKTLLAKAFGKVLGLKYTRVQFTPDLLPADILGTKVWRQNLGTFELIKGPIFTHVLLADEINRAPPKTQSALLEAMEERQVTIEGETFPLERPFFVIATQNPIEFEGTYPLPEAQLDRFLLRLRVGYPKSLEDEIAILEARLNWGKDDPTVDMEALIDRETFVRMQELVEKGIFISRDLLKYIAELVRNARADERVEAGPSPRGGIALMKVAKANALLEGRDFVLPDDVKAYAVDALAHRIVIKPEYAFEGVSGEEIVREALKKTPVPKGEEK